MAIVLGIASVLIFVIMTLVVRAMLYVGLLVALFVWLHLIVIGIISTGVGAIAFALLYEILGAGNTGFVWAGALAAGLVTGWWLLKGFSGKVVGWGRRFGRKKVGVAWQVAKNAKLK